MDDSDKGSHLESDKLDDIEKAFESDEMDDIEKGSPVECDISEVDNIAYAETVIEKVKYKGIASDLLQVPSCLKIDPEKVAKLKHLLVSTPDKTQSFCGVDVLGSLIRKISQLTLAGFMLTLSC